MADALFASNETRHRARGVEGILELNRGSAKYLAGEAVWVGEPNQVGYPACGGFLSGGWPGLDCDRAHPLGNFAQASRIGNLPSRIGKVLGVIAMPREAVSVFVHPQQ